MKINPRTSPRLPGLVRRRASPSIWWLGSGGGVEIKLIFMIYSLEKLKMNLGDVIYAPVYYSYKYCIIERIGKRISYRILDFTRVGDDEYIVEKGEGKVKSFGMERLASLIQPKPLDIKVGDIVRITINDKTREKEYTIITE